MLGRKSLLYLVSSLTASALSFIGLFFITRLLGADIYGQLTWALALMTVINSLSDMGFGSAHIKMVSEGRDPGDCISTYATVQIILIVGMVGATLLGLLTWQVVFQGNLSSEMLSVVLVLLLYYVLFDITNFAMVVFNAKMETAKSQLIYLVHPLVRVPLIALLCLGTATAVDLAYAYLAGGAVATIVTFILLRRQHIAWKRPTQFRPYMRFAASMALIILVGALSINVDKLLLGVFTTDREVAYYSSSQAFLGIFAIVGTALSTLAFPRFSQSYAEGDIASINAVTRQAERYLAIVAVPVTLLVVIFPSEVAGLILGKTFFAAGGAMRLLAISMFLTLYAQIYSAQLLAANRPIVSARITVVGFIVNLTLLIALVPSSLLGIPLLGLSSTGAAIANVAAAGVVLLLTHQAARRITLAERNLHLRRHGIAGTVTAAILTIISFVGRPSDILALALLGAISLLAYCAALWALRELTREDLRYFYKVFSLRDMKRYIASEIGNR